MTVDEATTILTNAFEHLTPEGRSDAWKAVTWLLLEGQMRSTCQTLEPPGTPTHERLKKAPEDESKRDYRPKSWFGIK